MDYNLIDPIDIAHSLSQQCRFAGHTRPFYSVAEHSVRVAQELDDVEDKLWGLLHDATETYLVDLPSPIKNDTAMGFYYREIEQEVESAIIGRFELKPPGVPEIVKRMDAQLLATERRDLLSHNAATHKLWSGWLNQAPLPDVIEPWEPRVAEAAFLAMLVHLTEQRKKGGA